MPSLGAMVVTEPITVDYIGSRGKKRSAVRRLH
jgi:hypothetical protein